MTLSLPRLLLGATALACLGLLPARAEAGDAAARARFVQDRDVAALLARFSASQDPEDRALLSLVRLAADPAATLPPGATGLPLVVDALRRQDLETARARAAEAGFPRNSVVGGWLEALLHATRGSDDAAIARLLAAGSPDPARDGFDLALLGAALAPDDREVLAAIVRGALVRAASDLDPVEPAALARAARLFDPAGASRALALAARALRRGGHGDAAAALLAQARDDAPAARLEAALLSWGRGDAAQARALATGLPPTAPWPWAFAALARAERAPSRFAAAPFAVSETGEDRDAFALARALTFLGVPTKTQDVVARAAAAGASPYDPAFYRAWLATRGISFLERLGDAAVVREALAAGLPVLLWRPRRHGERYVDEAVFLRGHDAPTDLLLADELDPEVVDVFPATWAGKARVLVLASAERRAVLDALARSRPGELAARVADALARLSAGAPGEAAERLGALSAEGPARGALDLYHAYVLFGPAVEAKDVSARARAAALARRASDVEPALAFERFVRSMEAVAEGDAMEAAVRDLVDAQRLEGPAAYLEVARFVRLGSARRHPEAMEALVAARVLDPLDVRTLYYRAGTRRLLGDARGARADLVRVLQRRPDFAAAAEELGNLELEAGDARGALAVVAALLAADPSASENRRLRQLRQRAEVRLVRRARAPAELVPLVTSPEPETRKEVAWAAASLEAREGEPVLVALLRDEDEGVRRKVALAFQRPWLLDRLAADPALLGLLVARLAEDEAPAVREALGTALARVEGEAGVGALLERLAGPQREPVGAVRAGLLEALGEREAPAVRRALVAALADDDVVARAAAIRALQGSVGTDRGFHPDDPPEARAEAVRAWERWLVDGGP